MERLGKEGLEHLCPWVDTRKGDYIRTTKARAEEET